MSLRPIAVLLAAVLLAPASIAPSSGAEPVPRPPLELPLDWFGQKPEPAADLWRLSATGPTTYSYLEGVQPASPIRQMLVQKGPPATWSEASEQTYTIVPNAGGEHQRRPLPAAAFLFASAICGIGGLAWWRCSSRGPT